MVDDYGRGIGGCVTGISEALVGFETDTARGSLEASNPLRIGKDREECHLGLRVLPEPLVSTPLTSDLDGFLNHRFRPFVLDWLAVLRAVLRASAACDRVERLDCLVLTLWIKAFGIATPF